MNHKECIKHAMVRCGIVLQLFSWVLIVPGSLPAQSTTPPEGIRQNTPSVHALINARIIPSPGRVIERGTLVIRNGIIESIGSTVTPADARIWDMKGAAIYPGLIDSYSDYGMPKLPSSPGGGDASQQKAPESRGPKNWNNGVLADQDAALLFSPDPKAAEKLRGQGFTSALVLPTRGTFKGVSAVVNLGNGNANSQIVRTGVAQHITFELEPAREGYPSSLMGVIALIRQTLLDANWYGRAHEAYKKNPGLPRPEINEPLGSLRNAIEGKMPVVIEASNELNVLRAERIAKEFSLDVIVRGSGSEYKRLDPVKQTGAPIILPINFPDAPYVQTAEDALQISLSELRYWDEAPENPAKLQKAGVSITLTTAGMKDPGTFLAQARKAVERGLSTDAALASLTTTPARLFGVERQLGSLEPGKVANFIITSGDLFSEKTVLRETWIDGKRYEVKPVSEVDPRGRWGVRFSNLSSGDSATLILKGEPDGLLGTLTKGKEAKLTSISFSGSKLSFSFPGDSIGYAGIIRMTANVGGELLTGMGEWPDGSPFTWFAQRIASFTPEPDTMKPKPVQTASFPLVYPHGEFGRSDVPEVVNAVLVKGATIWTSGPAGTIEDGDLLVQKGKIVSVGKNLRAPAGAMVVDGRGKHVTPGLIDAHSHTAASGSVNEGAQAISAEVRIGDVIDCDDISIYRELAGGLTEAHVLHGSANPIGGQSQLIKLRWGMLPEEMKFEGFPPTIKFALGENVKQSNWGDQYTTRYPQTRMGVEQIIRDEFQAALDYEKAWQKFGKDKDGIPPRRDLELDAIVEIIRGKRFVHCHSYRQDEILMLMRVAEDFGFKVRVFQHILEGYKVADVMAHHGAGASSFADWWGYKLEVYDAIPFNGALMHDQGVLVSFNSDSDELARRLNLESAKAVKYGGVPPEEALKFMTINPARQLKVDDRVGSLEPGKDADFVVWSGNPLSTYSMCEQTWIDGRKFFDRDEDRKMNEEIIRQRAVLVQKILAGKKTSGGGENPPKPPKEGDVFDEPRSMDNIRGGQQ